jgi:hypothetical protein
MRLLRLRVLALYPARAQSAEADGARARNRTDSFEHDYEHEQEHEKAKEEKGELRRRKL